MTSLSGVMPRPSYSARSCSAGLKVPSAWTFSAQGLLAAPGTCPPRWAPSCGSASGASSSPENSLGGRTSAIVADCANGGIGRLGPVGGGLGVGHVLGHGAPLVHPFLAPTVHDARVRVTVVLEQPPGVGREPVVVVAVQNHRARRGDPGDAEQSLDLFGTG